MRYLRLYLNFVRFSIGRAMEFRFDFTLKIIMDICYYVMHLSIYQILYQSTSTLAGWREDQAMVFIASVLMLDAIQMTILASNIWMFPVLINRGDLDVYLTRPVSTLFFISLRDFAANSFINLVIACGIFIYTLTRLQTPFGVWELLGYLLLILNGLILWYALQMLFLIPVFWTQSGRGFIDIFYSLNLSMERPDLIYRGALRFIFTLALPFGVVASMPARWFFGPAEATLLPHILGVTLFFIGFMLWLWKLGLKAYSSASS